MPYRTFIMSLALIALFFLTWPTALYAQEPVITITISTAEADPGDLFLAPLSFGGSPLTPTLLIMNKEKVIHKVGLPDFQILDFKRLPNGLITYFTAEDGAYKFLNNFLQPIGQIQTVGYPTDGHDIQLSPDGQRYLLMVYRRRSPFDMSQIVPGGQVTATLVSCLVQEVDKQNNLVWEWDSFDHTPITHSNRSLTTANIDYDHCNSLAYDLDGNILISSRHLDSVTKVNRATSEVMWRLGGVANDFTFTNDLGFSLQHDARRLPDGHLTLFDNGQTSRGFSRAVEYDIDEVARLITRTWEYTGPHSFCCGNVQRLPGGNTLINWAQGKPSVTEVKRDGTKVLELTIAAPGSSYRAFKFPGIQLLPVIVKNN